MADLTEIETFATVARTGSFAAAARKLGISPAMVGRRIQSLEERYDARLIERTTRAQRLTEIGETFLARAETLLDAADELDELVRRDGSTALRGRLRVTAPTTFGIKRLPPILAAFTEANPEVVVEIQLSDRRVDLVTEGFDLAVRIGELRDSSMVARRVGSYTFAVCASPDYLARHGTPLTVEDLAAARCIINLNLIPRNRWPFEGPGGSVITTEVSGPIEIDNGEAQRAAALAGAGIVYLPLDLAAEDITAGRLIRLFPHWQTVSLPIHTLHPSRRMVPRRVTAFVEAVVEGLREKRA